MLTTNEPDAEVDQVELCVLSQKATMLAWSTLSGLVKLMSIEKKEVKILGHHSDAKINLLKFSPSGILVLTASVDGRIKVTTHTIYSLVFI